MGPSEGLNLHGFIMGARFVWGNTFATQGVFKQGETLAQRIHNNERERVNFHSMHEWEIQGNL